MRGVTSDDDGPGYVGEIGGGVLTCAGVLQNGEIQRESAVGGQVAVGDGDFGIPSKVEGITMRIKKVFRDDEVGRRRSFQFGKFKG